MSNDKSSEGDMEDIVHQLEVALEDGEALRRRSSLSIQHMKRPGMGKRMTSCFVHGHFQDERLQGPEPDAYPFPTNAAEEPHIEDALRDGQLDRKVDKDPDGLADSDDTIMASRLLTKKQLSDMAFSIRELSKRLGRFRLKLKIRNVFLLTKAHDENLIGLTREVAEWLLDDKQSGGHYIVWAEDTLKENKSFDAAGIMAKSESHRERLKFWDNALCEQHPHTFDIIIALGGDGTVLYASWLFQNVVPPVLSFALGSLGFLTKFDYDDFRHTLKEVFDKGLTVSLRLRLEATVMRGQGEHGADLVQELIGDRADDQHTHRAELTRDILNDLVLDRGPNPTMSSIEVFGDTYHITTVQADGVCVATPTGSTAYNLAAGGSLCHPDNPVILVTAICAHTLSFRPIIIPDTVVLKLGVPYDARASCWVSFDGKERVELKAGDYVTISASRYPFPTVLPLGRGGEDWIDSLSRTLNWNERKKQKPFKEWR